MFSQLVQMIFTLISTIIGYWVAAYLGEIITPTYPGVIRYTLLIMLFSGTGYILGGFLGRILKNAVVVLDDTLRKLPGIDLIVGTVGLLVGLVIALIVSIPFIGEPFGKYVMLFSFLIFGFLGLFLSTSKSREISRYIYQGTTYFGEKVLDSSVLIDPRLLEIVRYGFLEGDLIVPTFVLSELQSLADSNNPAERKKGQNGLKHLNELRHLVGERLVVKEDEVMGEDVDMKLVKFCHEHGAALLTTDYNLMNVAKVKGVKVLNINDLQKALKEPVEPGDEINLYIIREGKERNQGVGYLEDGTMVVVNDGKQYVGKEVPVVVTGLTQTSSGRVVFGKVRQDN